MDELLARFAAELPCSADCTKEPTVTECLAEAVRDTVKPTRVWMAKCRCPAFTGDRRSEYRAIRRYDMAWTTEQPARSPAHCVQVKVVSPTSKSLSQALLLFLGDAAYGAVDQALAATRSEMTQFHALAVVPSSYWQKAWNRLAPTDGDTMRLVLEPKTAAPTGRTNNYDWIDPEEHVIRPHARTQFDRIYAAGTGGRYHMIYGRDGTLELTFRVYQPSVVRVGDRNFRVLLYSASEIYCDGELSMLWP